MLIKNRHNILKEKKYFKSFYYFFYCSKIIFLEFIFLFSLEIKVERRDVRTEGW